MTTTGAYAQLRSYAEQIQDVPSVVPEVRIRSPQAQSLQTTGPSAIWSTPRQAAGRGSGQHRTITP